MPLVVQEKGWPRVEVIVSGLPFANFPQELRDEILDGVIDVLQAGRLPVNVPSVFMFVRSKVPIR